MKLKSIGKTIKIEWKNLEKIEQRGRSLYKGIIYIDGMKMGTTKAYADTKEKAFDIVLEQDVIDIYKWKGVGPY